MVQDFAPRQQRVHHSHHQHHHHGQEAQHGRQEMVEQPLDIQSPPFYIPLRDYSKRYRTVNDLGSGSFGEVTLAKSLVDPNSTDGAQSFNGTLMEKSENYDIENAENKSKKLVAIKTMTKRLKLLNDYTKVKEVRFILALPSHLNLVQVHEMFIDNKEFKLHIAMECMEQNLYQLMKAKKDVRFSSKTTKSILAQILAGIRHIHAHNYFHRDIKPENILVTASNNFYPPEHVDKRNAFVVKLADFGLARHVDNRRAYTSYVSTRWYRSPEILLRKKYYSRPVDMWAFGCVAAEVASFRPLFPGKDELDQTWKVIEFLGTPHRNNGLVNYYPSYGYWDEAAYLLEQQGLNVTVNPCKDITRVLGNSMFDDLCNVIRECLMWNPEQRATADDICNMPYFKGTAADDYTGLNEPSTSEKLKVLSNHSSIDHINYAQSQKLAGIHSCSTNVFNPEVPAVNFSPVHSTTSPSLTDNASMYLWQGKPKVSPNVDTFGFDSSVNEMVPGLTYDGPDTNDENYSTTFSPRAPAAAAVMTDGTRDGLRVLPTLHNLTPGLQRSTKMFQSSFMLNQNLMPKSDMNSTIQNNSDHYFHHDSSQNRSGRNGNYINPGQLIQTQIGDSYNLDNDPTGELMYMIENEQQKDYYPEQDTMGDGFVDSLYSNFNFYNNTEDRGQQPDPFSSQ